jgi:hypothetical protein
VSWKFRLGNLAAGESLNYAFDVILPSQSSTPEPGSLGLLTIGLAAVLLAARKQLTTNNGESK